MFCETIWNENWNFYQTCETSGGEMNVLIIGLIFAL